MKKFLSFLLVIFSLIFLASCGIFNSEKKEELDLTTEEVQSLIDEVDFTKVGEDVVSLEVKVDVAISLEGYDADLEKDFEAGANVEGKFNLYANLGDFEDSYIYVDVDLSYEIDLDLDDFMPPLNGDENDIFEQEKIMFEKYKKASFVGKAYIIEGVLYLDLKMSLGGTTVEIKQYEEVFTEEDYNNFLDEIRADEEDSEDGFNLNLENLPEELDFLIYAIGDSYQLELVLKDNLEDVLDEIIGSLMDIEFEVEIGEDAKFENNIAFRFKNVLEKVSLISLMDLDVSLSNDNGDSLDVSVLTDISLELNLKGKMPKKLPTKDDFKDYSEGIDLEILEIFG